MHQSEIIAISNRLADEYGIPRLAMLACAVAESDLVWCARRPRDAADDQRYWPDVSAGVWQQTVAWSPEFSAAGGGGTSPYPGPIVTSQILSQYYDPEHAGQVAAPQIKVWLAAEGGDILRGLCRYNWPAQDPDRNPNNANYARGLRTAAELLAGTSGAADTRRPPPPTYNPDTPQLLQPNNWACSVFSATMALNSVGIPDDWRTVRERLGARVTQEYGLMNATGAGLASLFAEYGFRADYDPDASWEEVLRRAGRQPVCLGGRAWNHWTFVRSVDDDGDVVLGNPAPIWREVGQVLQRHEFDRWGGWSMVWIDVDEGDDPQVVRALEREAAELRAKLEGERIVIDHLAREVADALEQVRAGMGIPPGALRDDLEAIVHGTYAELGNVGNELRRHHPTIEEGEDPVRIAQLEEELAQLRAQAESHRIVIDHLARDVADALEQVRGAMGIPPGASRDDLEAIIHRTYAELGNVGDELRRHSAVVS